MFGFFQTQLSTPWGHVRAVLTPLRGGTRRGPVQMRPSAGAFWLVPCVTVVRFHTQRDLRQLSLDLRLGSVHNPPPPLPPPPPRWVMSPAPLTDLWKSATPTPQHHKFKYRLFWNLFLYKKGTIYITFIKSFRIIKYNITLLQKFRASATIQVKNSQRRVNTVPFSQFNMFFFFKQRPVLHVPTTLTRQD